MGPQFKGARRRLDQYQSIAHSNHLPADRCPASGFQTTQQAAVASQQFASLHRISDILAYEFGYPFAADAQSLTDVNDFGAAWQLTASNHISGSDLVARMGQHLTASREESLPPDGDSRRSSGLA